MLLVLASKFLVTTLNDSYENIFELAACFNFFSIFSLLESDSEGHRRMRSMNHFYNIKQALQWLDSFRLPHNSLLIIVFLITHYNWKRLTSKYLGVASHFVVERKENLFYFVVLLTC